MKLELLVTICIVFFVSGVFQAGAISTQHDNQVISLGITWYVGGSGPGNQSTIQQAISNASDGDTIFVYDDSAPYYEHISVYKQLTIIGENKHTTIIDGNGSGSVVKISANGVLFERFTVRNGNFGIELDSSTDNVTISKNIVIDQSDAGIKFQGFCEYYTISYNIIRNCNNGSDLEESSYGKITKNSFENNAYGIVFNLWCNENAIHFNNFIGNEHDVFFFTSSFNRWHFNYWDRPRLLPKPIFGMVFFFPMVKFDLRPLLSEQQIPD
ncbi:MAG: right-handed parallel beta-helix repeat-containing protein [Candidatus Thermoplasmatota archaeon]|nr:right-handed parallel beta-helix repeat-containing protein [Candidatus Thermoplasmatota archaeon]